MASGGAPIPLMCASRAVLLIGTPSPPMAFLLTLDGLALNQAKLLLLRALLDMWAQLVASAGLPTDGEAYRETALTAPQ